MRGRKSIVHRRKKAHRWHARSQRLHTEHLEEMARLPAFPLLAEEKLEMGGIR